MTQSKSDLRTPIPLGATILVALGILALNLFVLGPALTSRFSETVANISYVLIRILTILGFGYALGRLYGRTRMSVISLVTFVAFVEQIGFKMILFVADMKANPQNWKDVTPGMLLMNLGMSYILFVPVLCLLGFAGYELSRVFPRKSTGAP